MQKRVWFLIVVGFALLLPCCQQKIAPSTQLAIQQRRAKWSDIPFPLSVFAGSSKIDAESFVYTAGGSREELITFYEKEMERLGWKGLVTFQGASTQLIFEKPYKYASISIEQVKKGLTVVVRVANK